MRIFLMVFFAISAGISFAEEQSVSKKDVEFYLNRDGLKTIVEQVEERFLSGDEPRPLPDFQGILKDKYHYKFTGAKYIVKLDKFAITPRENFINIDLAVRKAFVSAKNLELRTTIMGKEFKFDCSNIFVDFDKEEAQDLSGDIGASIVDGKVKLNIQNIAYELNKKDITVSGPEKCLGPFGTKLIAKWVINAALRRARSVLESEMVRVLKEIVPIVEDILNDYTENSFQVKFDGVEPLPAFAVNIILKPEGVTIDDGGLRFVMDTEFDASKLIKPTVEKRRIGSNLGNRLGDIGFSPKIASDVLSEIFPQGLDYVELNKFIPAIDEYLTTSTASIVWPVILNEDLTKNYLTVSIRIPKIPKFYIDSEFSGLVLDANDIDVLFKVHKDGKWQDYFIMNTDIRAYTKAQIYNGILSFQVDERSEVFVDGKFLGVFAQQSDTYYDPEMAEFVLSGILDFLHGSAPLLGISIPINEIAGLRVGAEDVYFDSDYARVGVSELK